MALPSQDHQITWAGSGNGCCDGQGPIGNHLKRRTSRDSSPYIFKDALGIFRAGVIRGEHELIGQTRRNGPHLGAFAAIAIATAAKQTDQTPLHKRASRLQGIFQAIGGVGVIHQHRWLIGGGRHPLHAPRDPVKLIQGCQQWGQLQPLLQQHTHRLEQVHQVEPTHQWRTEWLRAGG